METKNLALVIILSILGGTSSVLVGHITTLLAIVPIGPFLSGQLLAGFHVVWLALLAVITQKKGAATMAGALKGIVEFLLPNHLGPLVFLLSFSEGLVIDAVLLPFKKITSAKVYLASGFSAASNIAFIQTFILVNLPLSVYAAMYLIAFFSGVLFGGYLCTKTANALRNFPLS